MQTSSTKSKNHFYLKIMTTYQLAANLISSFSIRTAYYARTTQSQKTGTVQCKFLGHKAADFPKCMCNRAIGTGAIAPFPNLLWPQARVANVVAHHDELLTQ